MKKAATSGVIILSMLFVAFLLGASADDFNSELLDAAAAGDIARVTRALDQGANIETRNEAGATPLMWAALKGHIEVVKLLMKRGADVNAKTSSGATALKGAATHGHLDIIRFLLEKGADPFAKDNQGQTTLDAARDAGQKDAMTILEGAMRKAPYLAKQGVLGVRVQDLNQALANSFGRNDTNGALVTEALSGGPAEKVGIKSGDIIVEINGQTMNNALAVQQLTRQLAPGAPANLKVFRDKKIIDLKTTLTGPGSVGSASATPGSAVLQKIGIAVAPVRPQRGLETGDGVIIKEVVADGFGARAGFKIGDVVLDLNGTAIRNVSQFEKLLADAKKDKPIRLRINRGSLIIFLATQTQ